MTNSVRVTTLLLRLGIGWLFFYAGWSKVITYFTTAPDWTAAFFLKGLEGPFSGLFAGMAGNPTIDYLNAFGLLLVGIAILSGVLVRAAAVGGTILMVLYYLASYPPEFAFLIDDHVIYILVFVFLAAVGAGRIWGLDDIIERWKVIKSNSWLVKLLG